MRKRVDYEWCYVQGMLGMWCEPVAHGGHISVIVVVGIRVELYLTFWTQNKNSKSRTI